MKNLIFILGSGRSGTKLISKIFAGQSQISSNHEFVRDFYQRDASLYAMGKLDFLYISNLLSSLYGSALYYSDAQYFLDSSNKLVNVADVLVKIFPDAKFIHLYRDGRKVVSSFFNKLGYNIYTDKSVKILKSWIDSNDEALPMPPPNEEYWWPLPKSKEDQEIFKTYDQFQRCCYHWVSSNQKTLDALTNARNKIHIKLEDLTANNQTTLDFFKYLEINISESIIKTLQKPAHVYVPIDYDFNEVQKIQFNQICSEMMHRLGYDISTDVYKMEY